MATRYWVGGSGNWSDATNHWSDGSGGSPGAGFLPTSADDVVFDAASNVGTGTFTVTVDGTSASPSICKSFSTGGAGGALDGAMTLSLGATAYLDCYGSLTLPATNLTWTSSAGSRLTFKSTTTGNTITTNGVSLSNTRVDFNGVGGEWTLGSAFTSSSAAIVLSAGSVLTANYNITSGSLETTGTDTKSYTLGSSTLTLSLQNSVNIAGSNITLDAGTSQINCTPASAIFFGGGKTFYNVSFTSTTAGSPSITDSNTFNNLSFTTPSSGIRRATFGANQTINNTLTLGAANTAVRRITARSDIVGTQRTLTAATVATLADVDFQDIKAAGVSAPWSGTRIGDCGNNTNITVTAAGNKYWYSATGAGGNWSAAQWETSSGGTSPSVNNFPLPQDTVKFQDTGLNSGNTITIDAAWNLPAIDGSARTAAMTLASSTNAPTIFGDITLVAAMTITGTGSWKFSKQGTQNVTTNGVSVTWPVAVENATGSVKALDNWTISNTLTLTTGSIDVNGKTITATTFNTNNTNTRSIAFGIGKIALTGNNATVVNMPNLTGFSYTGTPLFDCTYSGSTGTRTIDCGRTARSEATVPSFKVSAGSDTVTTTSTFYCKSLDLSGFAGTLSAAIRNIYGNLTVGASTVWTATTSSTSFVATSGTQEITSNGVTIDCPITINASGATIKLIDNVTIGSTRTLTFTAGTIDLNAKTLTAGLFASTGTTTRAITFGTAKVAVSGNNATVVSMGDMTNFTYSGTPKVELSYAGATGTRTVNAGTSAGSSESTVLSFYVTAGTDTVAFSSSKIKTLDTTGFSGTVTFAPISTQTVLYGDLVLSATTTSGASNGAVVFKASSGTQSVTTNSVTLNTNLTVDCAGATVSMVDAITLGAYTFTQSSGTLKLKNGTTNTAGTWAFSGSVSTPIVLESTSGGSRATISQASGTVNSTYLTVKDISATGGATFNAFTGTGSTLSNNNVNNGNNLGWNFIPAGAMFMSFF